MSSIGSTLHSINTSLLSEISAYQSSRNPTAANALGTSATASQDQFHVSKTGQLFQQLQQLQSSDPAEFKQVLTDAVSKFKEAAGQQADPQAAKFLNSIADRFQTAADTGDLSALKPPSNGSASGSYGPRGHHHHHAADNDGDGGSGAGTSATTSTTSSPASLISSLVSSNPASATFNTVKSLLSTLF